ncbi:MAG TPA: polyprenol monophosphomannose synthase [Candidatus Nanoarchaeia archaeon]|nr:polyprenol monophosphomannose synthase [Candidatus Nanoarchaeia archaeon]
MKDVSKSIPNSSSLKQDTNYRLQACIILPTYNEAGNIKKLLDEIFLCEILQPYKNNKLSLSILIVDDGSPDGTAEIVKTHTEFNKKVILLERSKKQGLGSAYVAGMEYAINNLKPDVVFEMDADLSHDPKDIFKMLLQIKKGSDFVIGSRYTLGGSIPKEWGIHRKIISKVANTYARLMLGIWSIHDCTGGFRAIRVSSLEKVNLSSLNVRGYAFQISLLNAMIQNNCSISEVPISFRDRTEGSSKMRLRDITEVGTLVLRLGLQKQLTLMDFTKNKNSGPTPQTFTND